MCLFVVFFPYDVEFFCDRVSGDDIVCDVDSIDNQKNAFQFDFIDFTGFDTKI